ncbi:MAG: hypothetical protein EBR15_04855, partial [Gammaproteobacteria bacterium]|nr:hypothetical protein [Gammaproteobacteria bacterium]
MRRHAYAQEQRDEHRLLEQVAARLPASESTRPRKPEPRAELRILQLLADIDEARATAFPTIVEHDPEDIWRSQLSCARRVLEASGMRPEQVAAIGITNQRETTILWDRATGRPVAPAIVWQSRVSAAICGRLRAQGIEDDVRRRTGLLLDPYFSATKIMHLLET